MTRRGDDGGFEAMTRRHIAETLAAVKPQDADGAGDIIILGDPPLVGEMKHYRSRAQGNPLARMINDALTEATDEAAAVSPDAVPFGICKRYGKGQPGDQLVVMTVDNFIRLVQR